VQTDNEIGWRIGELGRRVGVSTAVLRAWERRYGLLTPRRSAAGQRLYTPEDEQRIRDVQAYMARGYSAAVASRLVLSSAAAADGQQPDSRLDRVQPESRPDELSGRTPSLHELIERLSDALTNFDDGVANMSLDHLLAVRGVEVTLCDVVLPLLHDIGRRWAHDEVTVAQEHFASGLLMGRMRALSRGWDAGDGRRALMACPPGESHDLGLLAFSLLLRERGWRITYLGSSVPGDSLFQTAETLQPEVIVLSAVREEPFWDAFEALSELSVGFSIALGGAGATAAVAEQVGARVLPQDQREAVAAVTRLTLA